MSGTYDPPKRFVATNDVTGDMLKTKPPSDAYAQGLEVIQQNNLLNKGKTCEDCVTSPCVFPERKLRDNRKCSYFEVGDCG
jgi:hypothetical protein